MKRRELITLLGGATAAWPLAARAQQPAMPVIGLIHTGTPEIDAYRVAPFRQGLKETGYVEGQNLAIEYRWARGRGDLMPELVADLLRRRVTLIATPGGNPVGTLAAKAATTTVPIVFSTPEDPVRLGLVASLARPGGNLTGVNFFNSELTAKRLGLLRELVPGISRVAVLVNPSFPTTAESTVREVEAAAPPSGCKSGSSMPAPAARSMPPSRASGESGPMPCSSAAVDSSMCDACNWSTWRRATRSRRPTRTASWPKPAD